MPEEQASMLDRLFPKQVDNEFDRHRAALWLLGLFIALKLAMSVNSILNTASVASGADGLPLDSFGPAAARTVLMLFALISLGQLTLAVIALTTLIRYRAMVPFIYLMPSASSSPGALSCRAMQWRALRTPLSAGT